jgi:glycosyltransferase involved in cell wall biosynthesis
VRVLLLSAYDAASHRRWREILVAGLPQWDWTVLTQPARHFAWRARGNALAWHSDPRLQPEFDLVLATSLVDLAGLKGLLPALANTPACLYFHENQFAYPPQPRQQGSLELQWVSLYSALSARLCLFNSAYNRDSFLDGAAALLRRMPDGVPEGLDEQLRTRCQVLPVPVDIDADIVPAQEPGPLQIVWNHRWEYDKGPELLLAIVSALLQRRCDFILHLLGQQFRQRPSALLEVEARLRSQGRLGRCGYIESRAEYQRCLATCDVVLSTARHDFQGLSVLEASRLGATPLVPDGLAYPEWFGADFRYTGEAAAVHRLCDLQARKAAGQALPTVDLMALSPAVLLPRYQACLQGLVI